MRRIMLGIFRFSLKYPRTSAFLPPANEVCEGNVFTGVCLSTRKGGGSLSRAAGLGRGLCQGDPPYGKERAVRILLERILVIRGN